MVDDKPCSRAQEFVRNDQRPDSVIARTTASIANHMGVPFGETGVFGGIKPGVHTGENRKMAPWRQRQVAFVPKMRCVLGVCRQDFIEDRAHSLCPLYRVQCVSQVPAASPTRPLPVSLLLSCIMSGVVS